MQFKNLMIDLETFSTRQDAAIATIGAAFFDIETGEIGEKFHFGVHMFTQPLYGHVDPATFSWWLKQPIEAQNRLAAKIGNGLPLAKVLIAFADFICTETYSDEIRVWSNGATFDITILENAYQRHEITVPWRYYNARDVRTIVELGRTLLGFDPKKDLPFQGTQHDALDDAIHQAKYVSAIYQQLQHCVAARA
jgi:hypothetical protein